MEPKTESLLSTTEIEQIRQAFMRKDREPLSTIARRFNLTSGAIIKGMARRLNWTNTETPEQKVERLKAELHEAEVEAREASKPRFEVDGDRILIMNFADETILVSFVQADRWLKAGGPTMLRELLQRRTQ